MTAKQNIKFDRRKSFQIFKQYLNAETLLRYVFEYRVSQSFKSSAHLVVPFFVEYLPLNQLLPCYDLCHFHFSWANSLVEYLIFISPHVFVAP